MEEKAAGLAALAQVERAFRRLKPDATSFLQVEQDIPVVRQFSKNWEASCVRVRDFRVSRGRQIAHKR